MIVNGGLSRLLRRTQVRRGHALLREAGAYSVAISANLMTWPACGFIGDKLGELLTDEELQSPIRRAESNGKRYFVCP